MTAGELENKMINYNIVKDIVVAQLIKEGYLSSEEGEEFMTRVQVLVYKGSWFKRWLNTFKDRDADEYYIKCIEMKDKETNLDDLIRRTAQGK